MAAGQADARAQRVLCNSFAHNLDTLTTFM